MRAVRIWHLRLPSNQDDSEHLLNPGERRNPFPLSFLMGPVETIKRVTYPHLGALYITSEHFFRALGLVPLTPPFSSRRTLDLGKELKPSVVFQGGVAANAGMVRAFEETLDMPVLVPPHYEVMGAIGAAMLAHETLSHHRSNTRFKGFAASEVDYTTRSFECQGCSNLCEVVEIRVGREVLGRWDGRCGKWEM